MLRSSCAQPGRSQPERIVHGDGDCLLRAEVALGGLDGGVPEQELDLFELAAGFAAELGASAPEVVRAQVWNADLLGRAPDHVPHRPGGDAASGRSSRPLSILASASQLSTPCLTQSGTATVRTRPPLPRRSASTQRFSLSWMSSTRSEASSRRRRAQPTSSARIA